MEPRGCNRSQIDQPYERRHQSKTVAADCDRLLEKFMVRRGLRFESGRGFCKSPARRGFFVAAALFLPSAQTWKVGWKNQFCETRATERPAPSSSLTI